MAATCGLFLPCAGIDKYDGSVANPAFRRCELMTRIHCFENICNEMGYVGELYTLTAPARYHATIKTGHRNRKWNGASPADTQRYLCNVWQKVRAKLHREEIRVFGIRVAEPHHDGTPHWHMLMFMLPEDVDRVLRQFQLVGDAPVTVYRELRRMADSETAQGLSVEFAAAHDAADAGDWAVYVNAQGGLFVRRDGLAFRTWYQSGNELNEYGEETVSIKGVYATSVGDDTPILTRLTKWKIVPKRAVDLAVDVKGAPAPSRSSVNNCTEQQTEPEVIDFTQPLTRAQRRRLIARLHSSGVKKRGKSPLPVPERSDARDKLREMVMDISAIRLTESEITRMMTGEKVTVNGQSCFSGPVGNLYRSSKPAANPLARLGSWQKPCWGMISAQKAGDQTFLCDTNLRGFLTERHCLYIQ